MDFIGLYTLTENMQVELVLQRTLPPTAPLRNTREYWMSSPNTRP